MPAHAGGDLQQQQQQLQQAQQQQQQAQQQQQQQAQAQAVGETRRVREAAAGVAGRSEVCEARGGRAADGVSVEVFVGALAA